MSLDQVEETLKHAPLRLPGRAAPITLREALGDDSPYFPYMALNLLRHDPSMLTMLLKDFETVAAGYEPTILPHIHCPVVLLQADPATGGLLSDDEVRDALPLLRAPQHIRLHGIGHALYNQQPAPVLDALTTFLSKH